MAEVRDDVKLLTGALLALVVLLGTLGTSLAGFTATTANGQTVTAAPDWTPPTVTVDAPAGPLRGTVAVTAVAVDDRSSVDRVEVQLRPVGGTWTTRCALTPPSTVCSVPASARTDGTWQLRAVAGIVRSAQLRGAPARASHRSCRASC